MFREKYDFNCHILLTQSEGKELMELKDEFGLTLSDIARAAIKNGLPAVRQYLTQGDSHNEQREKTD